MVTRSGRQGCNARRQRCAAEDEGVSLRLVLTHVVLLSCYPRCVVIVLSRLSRTRLDLGIGR